MEKPTLKDLPKLAKSKKIKVQKRFSDENIQKIFGHEAAEDENIERLKEYYFKSMVHERITADLKLRILVGHKGIGKSALFKIAAEEDKQNGILSVNIQPNDISEIATASGDFLKTISAWEIGIKEIISLVSQRLVK